MEEGLRIIQPPAIQTSLFQHGTPIAIGLSIQFRERIITSC
jgi:hypothetical protein